VGGDKGEGEEMCVFEFSFPLDLGGAIFGGLIGLLLVALVDFLREPKVQKVRFSKFQSNFGLLYKIHFKILPRMFFPRSPGTSMFEIRWKNQKCLAKWDEMPNPLQNDKLSKFVPELVPSTFFQPLIPGREYQVPLIISESNSNLMIFNAWWFGRKKGYYNISNHLIDLSEKIEVHIQGANLDWKQEFKVSDIINPGNTISPSPSSPPTRGGESRR
jgi:hypothetical protein